MVFIEAIGVPDCPNCLLKAANRVAKAPKHLFGCLAQALQSRAHTDSTRHSTRRQREAFLPPTRRPRRGAVITIAAPQVFAHGDVVPQAVDTTGLKNLGADFLEANPYRKDKTAIRIGDSAYNQNCARCHGLGAVSGGIAPDLRYLPLGDEGDEVFLQRIRKGSVRDGRVYMPPFEGTLTQEAMWAIRSWLETVHEN